MSFLTRFPLLSWQELKLPFDLAMEVGHSISLLTLLQPAGGWIEDFDEPERPLISAAEIRVFQSLSHLLDPNPRRLKRIISVYALVTEVAKRVPLSEIDPTARAACADVPFGRKRPHLFSGYCLVT